MKKKAFTLIELIAVLVILAILALIVTPLVMNIIKKARIAADKRSIDAYGRSIELAIATYLLDNGTFPTSINDLQVEYSGDEVVCSTTQLNSDSSIYLTGCTVGGRTVDYTYGLDKTPLPAYTSYSVGDEVNYNNVNYYVIADSGTNESTVTLLKAEPLTTSEVNQYGAGHINRYTSYSTGTAYDSNGYGAVAYYSSDTCSNDVTTGCTIEYENSDIKYIVDSWAQDVVGVDGLVETRLLTIEDLINLGYEEDSSSYYRPYKNDNKPTWLYNTNYGFWTMSVADVDYYRMFFVDNSGTLTDKYRSEYGGTNYAGSVYKFQHSARSNPDVYFTVRPVIILPKSYISS